MKNHWAVGLGVMLLITLPGWSQARFRHDPLTPQETDQIREMADHPDEKLKLFIKFARARMLTIEQIRSDPKFAEGRGQKIHDLLEDVSELVDEVDRNVDSFAKRKKDIRKSLKQVIEMDSEFQVKLRALRDAANDPNNKEGAEYRYAVEDCEDSVNASADDARDVLEEQDAAALAAKQKKK